MKLKWKLAMLYMKYRRYLAYAIPVAVVLIALAVYLIWFRG
jgi:hypothetical protein